MHSEFNPSAEEATHLLQIWIEPDVRGIAPEYEQRVFADADKRGRWLPIATPDGRAGSFAIHQDASLLATLLAPGESLRHELVPERRAYVHVVSGDVTLNGLDLSGGDGAKIEAESRLEFVARGEVELLLFDLP